MMEKLRYAFVFIGIGIVLGAIVVWVLLVPLGARMHEIEIGPLHFEWPRPGGTVCPTQYPTSPPLATSAPEVPATKLPLTCTPDPTYTLYPTYTPYPTQTPYPTHDTPPTSFSPTPQIVIATITPTATPEPSTLFFDDFEDGLDPAWEVVSGDVVIVNGRLTTSGGATLLVGDRSWVNYEVECDSWSSSAYPSNRLWVRVQDVDDYAYFRWRGFDTNWGIMRNGSAQVVPNSESGYIGTGHHLIRVVVSDSEYRAYISGARVSSFIDNRFPDGPVGINLYEGAQVDNFTVTLVEK
jgi:hypothetical protein